VIRIGTVVRAEGFSDELMVVGIVRGRVRLVDLAELARVSATVDERAFAATYKEVDPPEWIIEPAPIHVHIWSFEHDAWWAPASCGYTKDISRAGLYCRADAVRICRNANRACAPREPNEEIREVPSE